jgi:hypothetical protein
MGKEGILLTYRGHLDGQVIDMLIQLTDQKLTYSKTRTRVKKKIINILVEALQNTYFYVEEVQETKMFLLEEISTSFFMILAQKKGDYYIFTGNKVDNEQVEHLKERVRIVNEFSEQELQEYYIKSLNKDILPQKGGAGLGLVDILRRAKHQVNFEFEDIDNKCSQFNLLIKIPIASE